MSDIEGSPSPFPDLQLATVRDVSKLAGTSDWYVYQEVSRGSLHAIRIGRALRFRKVDIESWLARGDAE
jgi:excisionase family DNA binding protein